MKKIILIDNTVAVPLPLSDKYGVGKPTVNLTPVGEVSDKLAESLIQTYPTKYALYDEKAKIEINGKEVTHKTLAKGDLYPEATQVLVNELQAKFNVLSREEKTRVLEFMATLNKDAVAPVATPSIP